MKRNFELYRLKAELCKTFADPKRLLLMDELRGGEKTVGELVRDSEIPQAVVSRHLAVLRHQKVVVARQEGRSVYYRLADPRIGEACDLVHGILLHQMDLSKELAESLGD